MNPATDPSCFPLTIHPVAGRDYATTLNKALLVVDNHEFLVSPRGCCFNVLTRCLLVCDLIKCCVHGFHIEFASDHKHINTIQRAQLCFGEKGTATGKFQEPIALDINPRNGEIAVADRKLSRVQVFNGTGQLLSHFGKLGFHRGEFRELQDLKFIHQGVNLAVVDSGNHRIQLFTTTGNVLMVFGEPGTRVGELQSPLAIEESSSNGDFFVCDTGNRRIQRFNAKGKFLCTWGTDPATQTSMFELPNDISIGFHGEIFVCDSARAKVFVFSNVGTCLHVMTLCLPNPKHGKHGKKTTCARVVPIAVCASQRHLMLITTKPSLPKEHQLVLFAPVRTIPMGRLDQWPLACLYQMLLFVTYTDAQAVRQVNRLFHRCCLRLRNEWKLFPLTPGSASSSQCATGLQLVHAQFRKWGIRHFKPPGLGLKRGVMDFEYGFRGAMGERYGAVFATQFATPLRRLFDFHASQDQEINLHGFVEIVTVIEEFRHGFIHWEQAKEIRLSGSSRKSSSTTRLVESQPQWHMHDKDNGIPSSLTLPMVRGAQQQTLNRLLDRLQQL